MANNLFNVDTLVATIVGSVFGFLSSLGIEWFKKRKPKIEQKTDVSEGINKAALDNVLAAQKVNETQKGIIDLLEERFEEERKYTEDMMERSKKACIEQIESLKSEYDKIITRLREDNDELTIKVNKYSRENQELSVQLAKQTVSMNSLQSKYDELKSRFQKYEQFSTNDSVKAMKKQEKTNE